MVLQTVAFKAYARDAITATTIFAAGDVLAQQIENSDPTAMAFSSERSMNALRLGLIWGGLYSPTVYKSAEALFPGNSMPAVVKKVATTTALVSCFGTWAMLFGRRILTADPKVPLRERAITTARSVNTDFPTVLAVDLAIWPATDMLVFRVVPFRWRVAFVTSVSVAWQTYLSYMASQGVGNRLRQKASEECITRS